KGLVEPGEAPLAAALREAREEASLDSIELPWGEAFRETEPYAGGKVARYYVGMSAGGNVRLPVSRELGRPEHHVALRGRKGRTLLRRDERGRQRAAARVARARTPRAPRVSLGLVRRGATPAATAPPADRRLGQVGGRADGHRDS